MMREVTSPDHSLALFVALAVPSDTPHFRLEQELWVPYEDLLFAPTNYDDNSTDASHTAPHSVMVTTLQAELDKIPFQSGFVNESLKSRSFLWRRREDYILAILHNALLSLISSKVVTLPPASESDVCEWLPRLVSCVATEIARQHKNPVAVVQAACTAVTNCRLAAFAATSIARAVPSAQRHQQVWAECVPCGRYWPVDVFVTHGSEVRCKMCFDKKALHFLASSKAEKREADCLDYVSTVQHFGHLIDRSISDALMATVTLVKAEAEYTAKFHCPMNPLHQTPFIVEIPENEQNGGGNAPVGIRCSECQVLWCSQCSYVHHPNAASCGEVSSVKRQWDMYCKSMSTYASNLLNEFKKEKEIAELFLVDRALAVARRRIFLKQQEIRMTNDISDLMRLIDNIKKQDDKEMSYVDEQGVKGSRRCPNCGRQPIRRQRACDLVVCGRDYHLASDGTFGNENGGCRKTFLYNNPNAAYQPRSTEEHEREMEQLERGLSVVKEALGSLDNQDEFYPPTLPNDWPDLSCDHCSGPLEGAFHMQCYHCVEPSSYRLCLHCVKDEVHAHSHHGGGCVRDEKMSVKQARERGGHAFQMIKPPSTATQQQHL